MAPSEVVGRARDAVVRRLWRRRRMVRGTPEAARTPLSGSKFAGAVPAIEPAQLPQAARDRLLMAAEDLLKGRWLVFGSPHPKLGADPDWFVDARNGRRAPEGDYAFDIPYRNEDRVGNIKYIWEPSRHHHLTVLAAAYASRETSVMRGAWPASAVVVERQSFSDRSALDQRHRDRNSPDRLDMDPPVAKRLEGGAKALREKSAVRRPAPSASGVARGACRAVARRPTIIWSRRRPGSSWQPVRSQFSRRAAPGKRSRQASFGSEAVAQTFPSGINRELASEYQGLVLELFLAAAIEGELSGIASRTGRLGTHTRDD